MPEGMPYDAPALRKRADKTPAYFFYCEHCAAEADGYTISDIDNPPHPMALNVYCHGTALHIGIEDVEGFREMMVTHQYRPGQAHPNPFKVFAETPARNGFYDDMELHDGP